MNLKPVVATYKTLYDLYDQKGLFYDIVFNKTYLSRPYLKCFRRVKNVQERHVKMRTNPARDGLKKDTAKQNTR